MQRPQPEEMMRIIWTLLKVIIGLAIAIPLAIVVFATTLGVLGALIGLAFFALKIAILALVVVGAFKLVSRLFGSKPAPMAPARSLPPADPHYEAAMRELEFELGERPRA
jgi:membrane protein YdbS with pleckstrin-like domain